MNTLLEWFVLLSGGWRPARLPGRGDGLTWFWVDPVRGYWLSRDLAYEVEASRMRERRRR